MCLEGCYSPSEVGVAYAASEVGLLCSEGRATKIKLIDAVWSPPCSVLYWVLFALFLVINSQLVPAKTKHPFRFGNFSASELISCTQNTPQSAYITQW